jgi:hypothetical protein
LSTILELDISRLDEDKEEHFAHYAEKASIVQGYVLGTPVLAICGKVFIPSMDPDKLPICVQCKKLADTLFL